MLRLPLRRVTSLGEALRLQPKGEAELFLYLLDVYDLDLDPQGRDAVCLRIQSIIVSWDLDGRVPGKMPLFTHLLLAFLVWMKLQDPPGPYDPTWAKGERLWVGDTTASDLMIALDTLSLRWGTIETSPSLLRYLRHLFRKGAWMTYHMHGAEILNIPSMRYSSGELFRVHPTFIRQLALRFRYFAREPTHLREEGGELVMRWLRAKNNLRLSAFRAEVLKVTWDLHLLPGDRGESTSLSCLQKRHPPALLEGIRQKTMAGNPEEDPWCLHAVKQSLAGFDLQWNTLFCMHLWKHRKRLHRIPVPIMAREGMHFRVYFLGHPQCGHSSFPRAFQIWLECVRDNGGKVYGKNLKPLITQILNPPRKVETSTFEVPV